MKMILPIDVDDTVLTASNITETDHAAWVSGTNYAVGARVIRPALHQIFEDLVGGVSSTAPENDSARWAVVGSTNRFRAWDRQIGQRATQAGSITYTLTLPSKCTAVAFFGLSGGDVRVQVSDGAETYYDETQDLVDTSEIVDFLTYVTWEPEYVERAVFVDVPGYAGNTLTITINAGTGEAGVGEIAVGTLYELGTIGTETELGFEGLSTISEDVYGNTSIVPRGTRDIATFQFAIPVGREEAVRRALRRASDRAAVFFGESLIDRGVLIYGTSSNYRPPLAAAGITKATLEVRGLA